MFGIYQLIVGSIFLLFFPLILFFVFVTGKHRAGIRERFWFSPDDEPRDPEIKRIWIHAASIGEVNAARIIIDRLQSFTEFKVSFFLTTMTLHGRDYARDKLGQSVCCTLAPLDLPLVVDLFIRRVKPDIYLCLETELWPLVIHKLNQYGVTTLLLNARISDKSISSYTRFRYLFKAVISSFDQIGAISAVDQDRLALLGAVPERITITGNIKHDVIIPDNPDQVKRRYRELLCLDDETDVFIAGSTHDPEEKLLLPIYQRLGARYNQLWLLAPRHIKRCKLLEEELQRRNIPYELLSSCRHSGSRQSSLLLVDTFGDLAQLYSVSSSVFIGGSLTDYGGHNLLEAAVWENLVFYGPFVQDFQEIADMLHDSGGGMYVQSAVELEQYLVTFSEDRELLRHHRSKARDTVMNMRSAGEQQVAMIRAFL